MKNTKIIGIVALSIFTFIQGCTPYQTQPEPAPDYTLLEEQVRELVAYSMQLFEQKDALALTERFSSDGTLKLPDAPLLRGHEALSANYLGVTQMPDFKLKLNVTDINISKAGDIAWVLAYFEVSFLTPGGPFSDQGTSLMVLHREDDKWKIAAENLSSGPSATSAAQ